MHESANFGAVLDEAVDERAADETGGARHDGIRGKVRAPVDGDHARRVSERRHLAKQLGQDVLPSDEQLDRLDARRSGCLDEILALDGEEPRLVAVLAPREKLPDEPELLVLAGRDQAAFETSSSRAAFAASTTTANAFGSDTAISASDLRSSSMPAFLTPAMKRL